MGPGRILTISMLAALAFWCTETLLHRFIFEPYEFLWWPSSGNELWMRWVVVALIIAIGIEAERVRRANYRVEQQKRKIFDATLRSTQHVLNNLMNQMQLVFYEADQDAPLSQETRQVLEAALRDSKEQIQKLGALKNLNADAIEHSISDR